MSVVIVQATAGAFFAADAFDNSLGLPEGLSVSCSTFQLITTRKCAAIQKDNARGIFAEEISGNFEHDGHAEVVLLGGVFNIRRRKERGADLIFIDYGAAELCRKCTTQCTFAGPRQARHKDEHAERIAGRVRLSRIAECRSLLVQRSLLSTERG